MSATTLPMSRPRMKTPIANTRLPFSRAMFIAPPTVRKLATSDERHVGAVRRRHEQALHARQRALRLVQPHDHAEALLALPHLRRLLAAERRLDHVLDVGDVEAVARRARAVDLDLDLRQLAQPVDEGARDARHVLHLLEDLERLVAQHRRDRRRTP